MRVTSLYLHGVKVGTAPNTPNIAPVKRGAVQGWSDAATRRNVDFLRSVHDKKLSGTDSAPLVGLAITLTLKDCPPTPEAWHKLRRAVLMRFTRSGMARCHWVTEWQRRGVPHLHMAVWFPAESVAKAGFVQSLIGHWIAVAAPYGASASGQHYTGIKAALGWFQYVAKHAARGVKHYQRSRENLPQQWQGKTGRVWGYLGDWPRKAAVKLEMDDSAYFTYRRLLKRWRIANARAEGDRVRVRYARRSLRAKNWTESSLRGVSEWIPVACSLLMVECVQAMGGLVVISENEQRQGCGTVQPTAEVHGALPAALFLQSGERLDQSTIDPSVSAAR